MSNAQRAKQFLPFSAVRGLEEALERKREELLLEDRVILDEGGIEEVNKVLTALLPGETVEVEYYDGRRATRKEGSVKNISAGEQTITIGDSMISFLDIRRIRKKG